MCQCRVCTSTNTQTGYQWISTVPTYTDTIERLELIPFVLFYLSFFCFGCSEFCDVVSKIHIYTKEEVEKMTFGMNNDDTHSCLEQAPVLIEPSKSSSVGQPDYSPTVVRV